MEERVYSQEDSFLRDLEKKPRAEDYESDIGESKWEKKSFRKMPRRKYKKRKYNRSKSVSTAQIRRIINSSLNKAPRPLAGTTESIKRYGPSYRQVRGLAELGDDEAKAMYANRLRDGYYGRGGYFPAWDSIKKYGRLASRGIGGALTAARVASQGADAAALERAWIRGSRKGGRVSRAIGLGDYDVSTNQIVGGDPMSSQQNVHHIGMDSYSDASGDIIYSNTEFVKNIYASVVSGTSPFHVESFALNPAMGATFPFLSQIAMNFELFEFMGLMFQYKPTSGEFGSNNSNALGKVVLATNYDPDASEFANSIVMENYDYACSTKPSSGCVHGVECAPSQRSTVQMYTRSGAGNKDKVFTDLGTFQLASEGIPSSVAQEVLIGELWVTYTVKLSRAKLNQAIGQAIAHGAWIGSLGTNMGGKIWTPQSANSITTVSGSPNGLEMQITGESTGSINLFFGNSYQGKRILLSWYSQLPASTFTVVGTTPINCVITDAQTAYQGTTKSVSQFVLQFDQSFTGTAKIRCEGSVSSDAAQIDNFSLTSVDPDFTLVSSY